MKLMTFSIFDEKAEFYSNPFYVPAIGIATRMLTDLVQDPSTTINKHPEDFTLYHIGYWNNAEAKFDNLATPKFICRATDSMVKESRTPEMYSVDQAETDRKETA